MKCSALPVFLLSLVSYCFISCSSSSRKGNNEEQQTQTTQVSTPAPTPLSDSFPKGQVIRNIACVTDASQTYCLYVPSKYDKSNHWPVIFFFDAHGRGKLPLYKYHELADKYGYIFIGSNNSENGQTLETSQGIYKALLSDAETRFSIDQARIYTCGFSGGSKVAAAIAILEGGISGVIGCCAGLPELNQPITNQFDYIGITADGDFNYQEMQALNEEMKQMNSQHELLVWKGGHQWPDLETMNSAFAWLQLNAMRAGKMEKNEIFIKKFASEWKGKADNLQKQNKEYDACMVYQWLVNSLKGLTDTRSFEDKLSKMQATQEVKKEIAEKESIRNQEMTALNQYASDMATKNTEWWKNEIKNLYESMPNRFDEQQSALRKRLLAYINLMSFMRAYSLLNNGQADDAAGYIDMYEASIGAKGPITQDGPFLQACLYTIKHDIPKAIASLQYAVANGYDDPVKLQTEKLLIPLHDQPDFAYIIKGADRNE